jgi:hypothetical protein
LPDVKELYPTGHGPQGDAIRIYNNVRLARGGDVTETPAGNPSANNAVTVTAVVDATAVETTPNLAANSTSVQPVDQPYPAAPPADTGNQISIPLLNKFPTNSKHYLYMIRPLVE